MEIKCIAYSLLFAILVINNPVNAIAEESMLDVTPAVKKYTETVILPELNQAKLQSKEDKLALIAKVMIDPEKGIDKNKIDPGKFMTYAMLKKVGLGFFVTWGLSVEKKQVLVGWYEKYMHSNPADVFFAPSADEIIKNRAAFGCSHYARAYIAVVKYLGLIEKPGDMRYVLSCQAKNYNQALKENNTQKNINGHQFVIVKLNGHWIAMNTSKAEWQKLPDAFSPDLIQPGVNIPITFNAYPEHTFSLRKAGKDYNDDCRDNSLSSLMNLYRSGKTEDSSFKWPEFSYN